jgi:predicted nucleotidyltransferase
MIVVPKELITEVYIPSRQLTLLIARGASDPLEEKALTLIRMLSRAARVPLKFFGIHGSINIGMHHEGSDIDIAVYGASHFRRVKRALIALESEGSLALKRDTRIEAKRLNRGLFQSIDFVVNATRLISEIKGHSSVTRTLGAVEVECRCTSAEEAMFRPAIYGVEKCSSLLGYDPMVEYISQLVSMVGTYRDVLDVGERLKARGMMEEVIEDGLKRYRVVVGSALPGEYLDWVG